MRNITSINAVIAGVKKLQEAAFNFYAEASADKFEENKSNKPLLLKKIREYYWYASTWNWMSTFIEARSPRSDYDCESCARVLK